LWTSVGVVVCAAIFILFASQLIVRGTSVSKSDGFNAFFSSPISEVKKLKGGGTSWMGHNVYLRFESDRPVILKEREKYKEVSPDEAITFFTQKFPRDAKFLRNREDLVCLAKFRSEKLNPMFGERLIINQKEHLYFFWSNYGH
jgi:hypothetical protein